MSDTPIQHRLEFALGQTWYDDLTWAPVADDLWYLTGPFARWQRGRSPELVRVPQPGTCSVQLVSDAGVWMPDNAVSPYYPDLVPGLPVRLSTRDRDNGGAWTVCFTGFAESFTPDNIDGFPNWTEVTLSAVDGWARVMQAGTRHTYSDRVLTDLAAGRDLSWIAADTVEVSETTGRTDLGGGDLVVKDAQQWGMDWFTLTDAGALAWTVPGAAAVVVETGMGDESGSFTAYSGGSSYTAYDAGFFSDRFGGKTMPLDAQNSGNLTVSCKGENFTRQQFSAGRPPRQMLPSGACDPTDTSGWTVTAGTLSRVAASGLSWVPRVDDYDPVTKVRTSRVAGPAGAFSWTSAGYLGKMSTTARFAVTAGVTYAAHASITGSNVSVVIDWYNSSSTLISSTTAGSVSPLGAAGVAAGVGTAPAGAVSAAFSILNNANVGGAAVQVHSPGLYPALPSPAAIFLPPARWWPPGADDHIHLLGQFPIYNPATAKTDLGWLHCDLVIDDFYDGELHQLAWNVTPGVGGSVVWVDDVEVTPTWWASTPGTVPGGYGYLSGSRTAPVMYSAGVGTLRDSAGSPRTPTQPSTITTAFAITGVQNRYQTAPNGALVDRWFHQYGAPAVFASGVDIFDTTDVAMGSLLDALAWPAAQRDLQTGRSTALVLWTAYDPGTDTGLDDYSTAVSALAGIERGWADVTADGTFRWLPRRWYDPDLDGVAVAAYALTWRCDDPDALQYLADGFTQDDSGGNVTNQVLVSSTILGVYPALLEDLDSQRRIGTQPVEISAVWRTQAEVDEVAAETYALAGSAQLLPKTVRLSSAYTSVDDLLALDPSAVVLVNVPMQPANDLVVAMLISQVQWASDGFELTADVTLSPCPVPADPPGVYGPNLNPNPYFETDITGWDSNPAFGSYAAATLNPSALHATGAGSLQVTWPGGTSWANTSVPVVAGTQYQVSADVWVPPGTPDVRLAAAFTWSGTYTSVKGATVRLTTVQTAATTGTWFVGVEALGTTAGQKIWIDNFRVREVLAPPPPPSSGLYPATSLYPSATLYPAGA